MIIIDELKRKFLKRERDVMEIPHSNSGTRECRVTVPCNSDPCYKTENFIRKACRSS